MAGRGWLVYGVAVLALTGCSGPIGLYHKAEGGAIAQNRQPPPGADAPYPNLASVPVAPVALTAAQTQAMQARLGGTAPATQMAAPGALAGLDLPDGTPPLPDVPGMALAAPAAVVMAAPAPVRVAAAVQMAPPSAPVALQFAPGSALLTADAATALDGLAAARGAQASVLVAGFGEASSPGDATALALGLARAERLANGLTADGVPPGAITLVAAAVGSGGFVQLVY